MEALDDNPSMGVDVPANRRPFPENALDNPPIRVPRPEGEPEVVSIRVPRPEGAPEVPPIRAPLPEGALDIPYPHEQVLHYEAGLYLDRLLRPLARVSGAIDRALALRLRKLRERCDYKRLGCARFADYAREHLGLAVRTAQEMVRLGKGLERLPLLDAALAEGRVTWTGALQVVRVAGKEDEAQWVALAEQLSVRELKQKVAEALTTAKNAESGPVLQQNAAGESGFSGDAERGSVMQQQAADANGSSGGAEFESVTQQKEADATGSSNDAQSGSVVQQKAADAMASASEAESGKPSLNDEGEVRDTDDDDPVQRLSVECAWGVARLWHAAIELCEMVVGGPMAEGEAAEYVLADLLSGLPPVPDDGVTPHRPPAPVVGKKEKELESGRGRRPVAPLSEDLGSRVLSAHEHRRIEKLLDLVCDDAPEDPLELDRSMKALIRARIELELDLARLLRNFRAYGLARHIGFRSFGDYVAERLGISIDRAQFLVRLDNRLIWYPEVRRAVSSGEIGTVAALLVCRVATEDTEKAWIERARKRTVERLKKEVEWVERESGRTYVGGVMPPPAGRLPSELDTVTAELIAGHKATSNERSNADDSSPEGPNADGAPSDGSNTARAPTEGSNAGGAPTTELNTAGTPTEGSNAGGLLTDQRQDEMFAHPVHAGRPVRVDFRLRESALELWQEVRQRLCSASGRWIVSDEQVLYEAALAFLVTYLPLWLHEVENGDAIAVRDHFECIVPGCTNRCGSPHHLRFRSQGGPDDAWNLAFLCHTHHLELLHQRGLIRVHGRAPDALVFELGIRPDGTAVEIFLNEERVEDQAIRIPGATALAWETSCGARFAALHERRPGLVQPRQERTDELIVF